MPFVSAERSGNAAGIDDATTKLDGPKNIATRLWFASGGSIF
ncbi:MAG TPA: hypothetical protein VFC65_04120 [Prolixibacteraceae bacterium]|nr:hypothetical protein [Prolixibacteraceae bacterium]